MNNNGLNSKNKKSRARKLRKAFLVPSESVLDTLKLRAIKKHMRFEEFYFSLMRDGYKSIYGKYSEEEEA